MSDKIETDRAFHAGRNESDETGEGAIRTAQHFGVHAAAAPGIAPPPNCLDCGLPYADFPLDVVLPRAQWLEIHPNDGGLLCASCIVKRAATVPGCTVVHAILEITPRAAPSIALPNELNDASRAPADESRTSTDDSSSGNAGERRRERTPLRPEMQRTSGHDALAKHDSATGQEAGQRPHRSVDSGRGAAPGIAPREPLLEDRIQQWREDDKQGFGPAIELLCEAEDEIRTLRQQLVTAEVDGALRDQGAIATAHEAAEEIRTLREQLADTEQQLDVLRPGGSYAWKSRAEQLEADNATLREQLEELQHIEPLHDPACPMKPYEDNTRLIPEDVECTCVMLAHRWKARAVLNHVEKRIEQGKSAAFRSTLIALRDEMREWCDPDSAVPDGDDHLILVTRWADALTQAAGLPK